MAMTERSLENLIYENPWLISFDLQPVRIKGEKGMGRQVFLKKLNRKIDLLFKSRSGQPVIIELKAGKIKREDISQLLEYGGAFRLLEDDEKDIFFREFGKMYAFPKLILIGNSIGELEKAAAGMAGIEVIEWKQDTKKLMSFDKETLAEYKSLLETGEHANLAYRHKLVDEVWETLREAYRAVFNETIGSRTRQSLLWWSYFSVPFCDFITRYDGDYLLGVVEYIPEDPAHSFNKNTWWIHISLEVEDEDKKPIDQFLKQRKIGNYEWYKLPYEEDAYDLLFPMSKTLFKPDNSDNLKKEFIKYLKLAKDLVDQFWE